MELFFSVQRRAYAMALFGYFLMSHIGYRIFGDRLYFLLEE